MSDLGEDRGGVSCLTRATIRALGDEITIMKSDMRQLAYEAKEQKEHIKDNAEKVKVLLRLFSDDD